jgi:uncharacterized phiE125 gp8 family phage protein
MMIIERITTPVAQAFDLSELKLHCRIDHPDDDMALARFGKAAASELEAYAQVALIDQTIRLTLDAWPRSLTLALPIAPVIDALSVVMTVDGQAFDAYSVTTGQRPALRLSGERPCGLIVIEYLAGFGPALTDLPADLANAILDQACVYFDLRGDSTAKSNGMSPHMARVAARYRRVSL